MRSIRYRIGTRRYRHSKRKERNYVFFTTISAFGTLTRNYRIYDMDVVEKAYGNMSRVLTVDDDAKELIKSMKNCKSGPKIVVDSLPLPVEPTTIIHDKDGAKINVKLKITKPILGFSDMVEIADE